MAETQPIPNRLDSDSSDVHGTRPAIPPVAPTIPAAAREEDKVGEFHDNCQEFLEKEKPKPGDLIEFKRPCCNEIYSHWGVFVGLNPIDQPTAEFINDLKKIFHKDEYDEDGKPLEIGPTLIDSWLQDGGLIIHRGNELNYDDKNLYKRCHCVDKLGRRVGNVLPASLKTVKEAGGMIRINNSDDKELKKPFPVKQILERCLDVMSADSENKMTTYHLMRSNCEHFVKWARNDKKLSWQSLVLVYRLASFVTFLYIIWIVVAMTYIYRDDWSAKENENSHYCCNSRVYEHLNNRNINPFTKELELCKFEEFETPPRLSKNIIAEVCVTCKIMRPDILHQSSTLFNTKEAFFWFFSWLFIAVLPWINFAILSLRNEISINCNAKTVKRLFLFSVLTLPIFVIASFPIQNLFTKRCCGYFLFSIHPIIMAILLFMILTSRCFQVPTIYQINKKLKWFINKVEWFTMAFAFFTGLFAIYEVIYLHEAHRKQHDMNCDKYYWWFIVIFAGVLSISVVIGGIILLTLCIKGCKTEEWDNKGRIKIC